MSVQSVSHEFRERSAPVWRAIHDHPFVRALGSGELSRERFEHYLKQDYVYLIEFGRVLALAAARSEKLADMGFFAGLLHTTLDIEMDLHRRTCSDFGITPEVLEEAEPSFVTTAYTDFLVRRCYEGRPADILAALLPCEAGYVEIAESLRNRGLPPNRHYRDWIETYSSAEFREFAQWVAGKFDELACDSPRREIERWYRLYLTSAKYELFFFEMSWRREVWPVDGHAGR
jgi:thiaminase (transcriptional activator TenA)